MAGAGRSSGQAGGSPLTEGRRAYGLRAWEDAYQLLLEADAAAPLVIDDLNMLVWSAALTGRDQAFLEIHERIFQACLDAGQTFPAARAAFWLGLRLFSLGEMGRGGGWLGRAEGLVEGRDCAEQGYLLLPAIHRHLASGNYEAACAAARKAAETGVRFGEPDLVAFARSLHGRAVLRQGKLAEGLALLDEAMMAVTTGDLLPLVAGLIYCTVIDGCQEVFAFDRCREWTSALAAWCQEQPQLVTFTGICLVHRAEVMQLSGAWADSIVEARRAGDRVAASADPEATAAAFYQQAEIYRLRGEFARAEEAYRSSSQSGGDAQPGLALLRLAQGQDEAAESGIRRAAGAATSQTSRMRLLPAYVEIMLALGKTSDARAASAEIEAMAADYNTEIAAAMAGHALGAVRLAEGDFYGALGPLRRAFGVWQQFGAPYLACRLRVLVGQVCLALGDDEGADLEFAAARAVFEELGAVPDIARLDALAGQRTSSPSPVLTPRECEVLRLVAGGKTNKAIASLLSLSEETVDRHVSNIFTKIDVHSRSAATAYAYEHKLV